MIASLKGRLESLGGDWAVISVGGIGYQVHMPTSTISVLGIAGAEVKLYTHLQVREDNLALYGFKSAEELALFQTLIGVSGLGPRLALAMLSAMDAEKLVSAIATGSADLLTSIPGIGKKVANRIILELKEKIGSEWITTSAAGMVRDSADVVAALVSLGYSVAEANRAVATLSPTDDVSLEDKIKLALQYFGGK